MATSRTGTTTWKNLRKRVLYRAKKAGLVDCPECGVALDYRQGLQPNSAEVDHIVPHSRGGKDHIDNCAVLCRQCNQSKGSREKPKTRPAAELRTSREW